MDKSYAAQNRDRQVDVSQQSYRYYRNAVERHWDPYDIDFSEDADRIIEMVDEWGVASLERLRGSLRAFGAGEEAVTEDLVPLAHSMNRIEDEMFLTTQMYEEAKHTDLFDRYWSEVIHDVEGRLGLERSSITDFEDYNEDYFELFERNERAQNRLLEENTPLNRAKALAHYHLVIEGIAAQTGYFALHSLYGSDQVPEMPVLPGFAEGFSKIRRDEGRHVGFGMWKLKQMVSSGEVDPQELHSVVNDLVPLVKSITAPEEIDPSFEELPSLDPEVIREYATSKHMTRMQQIVNASEEIPDVDELTRIEPVSGD